MVSESKSLECIRDIGCEDLVVYLVHNCIPCDRITHYLSSLGVPFTVRFVDENKEFDEELRILTGNTLVPILLNRRNGRIMLGCPIGIDEFFEKFLSVIECK